MDNFEPVRHRTDGAPAGTVPAAPVVIAVTPISGPAGGGNDVTVTGLNLSGATAIEIGTTAEFATDHLGEMAVVPPSSSAVGLSPPSPAIASRARISSASGAPMAV
jgi:hypothetical protein